MTVLTYDIIVVGGGHAGCEAAAAAARLGSHTLLISIDLTKVAQMSCNPAIGGIAKGQIVREIDALGGYTGIITDRTTLQFRMLNKSKGPAMWSPRAQCDRVKFSSEWRTKIEKIPTLDLMQDNISKLIIRNGIVNGVITCNDRKILSKSVILANGTFLNGLIHIGKTQISGGRINETVSCDITKQLVKIGFISGRMKTGTPPRIDGRTIDFEKTQIQESEMGVYKFSYLPVVKPKLIQRNCFITYTNPAVHEIIQKGIKYSPLYNGTIKSIGPRYCPSIETKIKIFPDKERHQIFIEPEGENTNEYYINGFSTSLPAKIQYNAIHQVDGLRNAKIIRPGYAIEYDYFDPTQMKHSLETKIIGNLFFAGQINGTTGYEEAAGQGLMSGINAHRRINGMDPLVLGRNESYIGVLIDDLVTKGVDEPYRMFTSRAEFRILLRQDNADKRLTKIGYNMGLADRRRYQYYLAKEKIIEKIIQYCRNTSIEPSLINSLLIQKGTKEINQKTKIIDIISRPQIKILDIFNICEPMQNIIKRDDKRFFEITEAAEIEMKYEGYIQKEKAVSEKIKRLEGIKIVNDFNYFNVKSLSTEAKEKLTRIRPVNLAQAGRISGVSPADINVLLIYLGR